MPSERKNIYSGLVFPQPHPLSFGLFMPPSVNILHAIALNLRHNRGSVDKLLQDISKKLFNACRINANLTFVIT